MNKRLTAIALSAALLLTGCGAAKEKQDDKNTSDSVSAISTMADTPEFSEETMFTLRIYQPWFYESPHYTLKSDGTLIVLYYSTELGREKISDEKMQAIREVFSPEKVYSMDIGKENERTDGTSRYIVLYDHDGNEIEIGGYELEGGDGFNRYFYKLYELVQDDYTKQWSDKFDECNRDDIEFGDRYIDSSGKYHDNSESTAKEEVE